MSIFFLTVQLLITKKCESKLCHHLLVCCNFQLVGGAIGDKYGRHKAMTIVMMLQIFASIGSALSYEVSSHFSIYTTLAAFRFLLGVGCGGVYPLAATMTAESTSTKAERGKLIALTFSIQGVGYICVPIIQCFFIFLLGEDSDLMWRLILGLGSVPGVWLGLVRIVKWSRHESHDNDRELETDLMISDSDDLTTPLILNSRQIDADGSTNDTFVHRSDESTIPDVLLTPPASIGDTNSVMALDKLEGLTILDYIRNENNLIRKLVGTAGTWFLFDVIFYGNTLFERVVLDEAFGQSETIAQTATDTLIISAMALPGYFVSIAVIGRVNPRYVQMQGFLAMAIVYGIIGVYFDQLSNMRYLLIVLYGSTFFFANFGPNATTFMLPSIIYSPKCRSTLNGLSAASGKAGALIGASFFEPMADSIGDKFVMLICAGLSIIGFLLTHECVPLQTQDDDADHDLTEKRKNEKKEQRKSQDVEKNVRNNGEVRKSYSGYEFWRRRKFNVPSFIDYADSDVESVSSSD